MNDEWDEVVVEVRASSEALAQDLTGMRNLIDGSLSESFDRAGASLERGLIAAIRRGSLGFDDLKQIAFRTFDQIAAQALQTGLGSLFGNNQSGFAGLLGQTLGGLLGLPGRETGGLVSPGSAYLVGERGPEVFVPNSAGHVDPPAANARGPRDVQVAIQISPPATMSAPVALRRSSRQLASALQRALRDA